MSDAQAQLRHNRLKYLMLVFLLGNKTNTIFPKTYPFIFLFPELYEVAHLLDKEPKMTVLISIISTVEEEKGRKGVRKG